MINFDTQFKECYEFGIVKSLQGNITTLYCRKYKTECKSTVCLEEREYREDTRQLDLFEED